MGKPDNDPRLASTARHRKRSGKRRRRALDHQDSLFPEFSVPCQIQLILHGLHIDVSGNKPIILVE